jgi:hypothetical protein
MFGNYNGKGEDKMKKFCLSNLPYLLLAIMVMAMTGCGANSRALNGGDSASGSVTAKLVIGKGAAAKAVAATLLPSGIASLQFTVTGTDATGKAIPVVRNTITQTDDNGKGTVTGIYPGQVTVAVKALAANGTVVYEGFALNVTVAAGPTPSDAGTIVLSQPLTKPQDANCVACHETTLDETGQNLVADFKQSGHYANQAWTDVPRTDGNVVTVGTGCAGCHGPSHNDTNPAASGRCYACHGPVGLAPAHKGNAGVTADVQYKCDTCHNAHNTTEMVAGGCVVCHAVGQSVAGDFVNDNNGVRAITAEFKKWSHHVTGVTLNDAHCAACHLEGKINAYGLVAVDGSKHMADAKIHLRNADTDADMAWDPANPNFTTMDNFCLSCHDSNGATSAGSVAIQTYINKNGINATGKTASASNPFGDTISNRYDKLQRPAVVDAFSQFDPSNNSHHAVRGARYSGRTRAAGPRQIKSPATFANNSSNLLKGARSTIYDAGNFNSLYSPLGTDGSDAQGLGDDSTLHCGDCHTVGQWKVGSSDTANGTPTPAAIGAHGSNNEYLLRNTLGTDQRHTQNAFVLSTANVVTYTNPGGAFLVCYNCHAYTRYGSIYVGTGLNTVGTLAGVQPHAGEYDQDGRCNGVGNTIPFNGYTTGKATDGSQYASRFMSKGTAATTVNGTPTALTYTSPAPYAGEQTADFGNIFGIQCANCHNSGMGNAYGGIHGSAKNQNSVTLTVNPAVTGGAYIDGMGNTTKIERFLPGLGNVMHVPGTLGGFSGGTTVPAGNGVPAYTTGAISNDTNWEQKFWQQTATTNFDLTGKSAPVGVSAGAGCYTLGVDNGSVTPPKGQEGIADTLRGPSVTGQGGPATEVEGTWGGCEDHGAVQGAGNHGFVKRIVRPVTY